MENITARKDDVLLALGHNRDAHRAIFEEALAGYRDSVVQALENHLAEVKSGRVRHIIVNLPMPEDHTKDYDRAIRMIQLNVGETIELSETDVMQYVMDDWRWKQQFLTSNSLYSASAAAALG